MQLEFQAAKWTLKVTFGGSWDMMSCRVIKTLCREVAVTALHQSHSLT
jgi:hypothetical protein